MRGEKEPRFLLPARLRSLCDVVEASSPRVNEKSPCQGLVASDEEATSHLQPRFSLPSGKTRIARYIPVRQLTAVAARGFFSPRGGRRNVSPRGREFKVTDHELFLAGEAQAEALVCQGKMEHLLGKHAPRGYMEFFAR
ncbi:hypothetical protein BHM03_00007300 [Ensete ventricosum]|nr:hypothetical protein BHM03_00007300 [Ensete ventricosum]